MMETKNTVLVVDDEEMNRKMLSGILSDKYEVQMAASGAEALEIAHRDMPDLILLDVLMPEMDGYEVLAALKDDDKTRKIPVIFITGLDSKEDEEKGLSMDAADYISKPFSVGIVRLRVKNQIQIVNQIRMIEALSLMDQLTGVPNRRSLDNRFAMEWARAYREKLPISLLMMDIDKFKVFNDTYGHLVGDDVLKLVAASFELSLKRKSDFAARFGGEEFSVLLPNTAVEGALPIAESIRREVERLVIPCGDGKTTTVTVSIGLHTFIPAEGMTIPDMIAKADEALYHAKETGRNRVCVYGEEEITTPAVTSGGQTPSVSQSVPLGTVPTDSSTPQTDNKSQVKSSIFDKVREIEDINLESGLSHFQGMNKLYVETLETFYERISPIAEEMKKALADEDIKAFAISVHSVKSMLSTIGATKLARKAEKLEKAAKGGDMQFCVNNYTELHDRLAVIHLNLSEVFGSEALQQAHSIQTVRKKIIHVDDVNYTLVSLRSLLNRHFEIYSVSSHKQMFDVLGNIIPDLILLDIMLPEMDGYEIIRMLKENPRFKDIPVVFLTSLNDEETINKCMVLGAADVIVKPVSNEELIKRISDVL